MSPSVLPADGALILPERGQDLSGNNGDAVDH
jgi:hypothetical protein